MDVHSQRLAERADFWGNGGNDASLKEGGACMTLAAHPMGAVESILGSTKSFNSCLTGRTRLGLKHSITAVSFLNLLSYEVASLYKRENPGERIDALFLKQRFSTINLYR